VTGRPYGFSNLLEHHHQPPASIIKSPSAAQLSSATKSLNSIHPSGSPAAPVPSTSASVIRSASPTPSVSFRPKPTSRRRPSGIRLIDSYNLATARGRPGAQPRRGAPVSAALSITMQWPNAPPRGEDKAELRIRIHLTRQETQYRGKQEEQMNPSEIQASLLDSANQTRSSKLITAVLTRKVPRRIPQQEKGFKILLHIREYFLRHLCASGIRQLPPQSSSTHQHLPPYQINPLPPRPRLTLISNIPSRLRVSKKTKAERPFRQCRRILLRRPTSGGTVSYAGMPLAPTPHPHTTNIP